MKKAVTRHDMARVKERLEAAYLKAVAEMPESATQREVGDSGYPDPDTGSWLSEPPLRASEQRDMLDDLLDMIRHIREQEGHIEQDEEPEDITTGVIRAAIGIGVAFVALVLFFWLML